ncbi:MAG TPA: hypothetical protein VGV57_00675 [Thermoleophilaceae bacterium]|nr:hypothetical protein [Thermoleophilaceae bacterium]
MATLHCRPPTQVPCRYGTVAPRLRRAEIEFDGVRVPFPKRDLPTAVRP